MTLRTYVAYATNLGTATARPVLRWMNCDDSIAANQPLGANEAIKIVSDGYQEGSNPDQENVYTVNPSTGAVASGLRARIDAAQAAALERARLKNLTATSEADNLIDNGTFNVAAVDDWSVSSAGTFTFDGAISAGKYSLWLTKNALPDSVNITHSKYFPIEAGQAYYARVMARAGPSSSMTHGFYFRIIYYDANFTALTSSHYIDIANNQGLTTALTTFDGQFTPSANARFGRVRFYNHSSQATSLTVIVDSVSVSRADSANRLTNGSISDAKISAVAAAKISGTLANSQIASGLDAGKLTVGTIPEARITSLAAAKVTGALADSNIPNLAASKITSGAFSVDRIPGLAASKITSGTFGDAFIASGLDAGKLTTGTLPIDRIADSAVGVAKLAETNTGGNLVPDGIMREQDASLWDTSSASVFFVSGGVSGAGALAITLGSGATDCYAQTTKLSSIESGETYALRVVWLGSVTASAAASVEVNYYDASQGFLSTSRVISTRDISSATWTIEETVITAPTNARFIGFRPVASGPVMGAGAILYVDTLYCAKQIRTIGLGDGAVRRANILDGEVINSKIAAVAAGKVAGVLADGNIPGLAASKIISGTFDAARYGDGTISDAKLIGILASKVSGVLADGNIPALAASKITSGTFDAARFAAASIDNGKLGDGPNYYRRLNVLGTVSKSIGIPTGALIESGVNANGQYAKYTNGQMVCWHRVALNANNGNDWSTGSGGIFITGSTFNWTFPAAFETSTSLTVTGQMERAGGEAMGLHVHSFTNTTGTYRGWTSASMLDTDVKYAQYFAIGRWDILS